MAKAAKAAGSNDYNGKQVNALVKRVMDCHDELDELTGAHMNRCGKVRKRIAGVIEEAKAVGIPKPVMKLQVEIELAKRKLRAKKDDLEPEIVIEARLVAEARNDEMQNNLFGWTRENRPTKAKIVASRKKLGKDAPKDEAEAEGEAGSDLTASGKPPVGKTGDELKGDEFKAMH
jgi:hypothetical protein